MSIITTSSDISIKRPIVVVPLVLSILSSMIITTNPDEMQSHEANTVEIIAQSVVVDVDSALRNAYINAIQKALGLEVELSHSEIEYTRKNRPS